MSIRTAHCWGCFVNVFAAEAPAGLAAGRLLRLVGWPFSSAHQCCQRVALRTLRESALNGPRPVRSATGALPQTTSQVARIDGMVEQVKATEHGVDPSAGLRVAREVAVVGATLALAANGEGRRKAESLPNSLGHAPLLVTSLIHRLLTTLPPYQQLGWTLLALELGKLGSAPSARQRRVRQIPIEHPHGLRGTAAGPANSCSTEPPNPDWSVYPRSLPPPRPHATSQGSAISPRHPVLRHGHLTPARVATGPAPTTGGPARFGPTQQPCQAAGTDETPTFQRLGRAGAFPSACALS